jgi:large subunit ribosomal protein L17
MCSLIQHQRITTTLPKAKELRPLAEKLITRAKKGGLFNRRLVIARVGDITTGSLLVDVIAPQIKRDSGYLRIAKLEARRGDNAPMAEISFVDEIKKTEITEAKKTQVTDTKPTPKTETTAQGKAKAKQKGVK